MYIVTVVSGMAITTSNHQLGRTMSFLEPSVKLLLSTKDVEKKFLRLISSLEVKL